MKVRGRSTAVAFWIGGWLVCGIAAGQPKVPVEPKSSPAAPEADPLGRTTPRGAVLGFVKHAHQKRYDVAAEYLNTRLRGADATRLANQLFVVLDRRLAARLNELSNKPEGSLTSPAAPKEELIGTIQTESGDVDIVLERVSRSKSGPIWLFSRKTLESIPAVHAELSFEPIEHALPPFLVETRIGGIALFQWLALCGGLPLFFFLLARWNRLLGSVVGGVRRLIRHNRALSNPNVLRGPVRVLLLVVAIRWALSELALPLLARQFWSSTASVLFIAALVWLGFELSGWAEAYIRRRLMQRERAGLASILSLARWGFNLLFMIAGVLVALHHFGIDLNTTLAGLGIGGIAVALAAQKTLENIVGGVSIIFDRALRVGDLVKASETFGFVQDVGLRSTRIRTFDRTIVSVPNGLLATVTLENLSKRDTFWFHHFLRLDLDTTSSQLRSILEGVSALLTSHPQSVRDPLRVHFQGVGPWSLNIEVFSYLAARNWDDFLRLQQELLLKIIEIIESAGAGLAYPAPTIYLAFPPGGDLSTKQSLAGTAEPEGRLHGRDAA